MGATLAAAIIAIGVAVTLAGTATILGAPVGITLTAAGVAIVGYGLLGIDIDRNH